MNVEETPRRRRQRPPPAESALLGGSDRQLRSWLRAHEIKPHDLDLYRTALNHKSATAELGGALYTNERLEFLGDAILGAVVAARLYHEFPDAPEGLLTAQRTELVRTEQLVRWAREIGLAEFVVVGRGEGISESPRDRILAGAFEALIGATMLDLGIKKAEQFLQPLINVAVDSLPVGKRDRNWNPKGRLQEWTQARFQVLPEYIVVSQSGPAHQRWFVTEVLLGDLFSARGSGSTKRASEEAAARLALDFLYQHAVKDSPSESDDEPRIVGE